MQVLHLADNSITSTEGLQNLPLLQDLNLANNPIQTLGRGLAANLALQDLNVSATQLGSFRCSSLSCLSSYLNQEMLEADMVCCPIEIELA